MVVTVVAGDVADTGCCCWAAVQAIADTLNRPIRAVSRRVLRTVASTRDARDQPTATGATEFAAPPRNAVARATARLHPDPERAENRAVSARDHSVEHQPCPVGLRRKRPATVRGAAVVGPARVIGRYGLNPFRRSIPVFRRVKRACPPKPGERSGRAHRSPEREAGLPRRSAKGAKAGDTTARPMAYPP